MDFILIGLIISTTVQSCTIDLSVLNLFIACSISSLRIYGSCSDIFKHVLHLCYVLCAVVNSLQYSHHLLMICYISVMSFPYWSFADIYRG